MSEYMGTKGHQAAFEAEAEKKRGNELKREDAYYDIYDMMVSGKDEEELGKIRTSSCLVLSLAR